MSQLFKVLAKVRECLFQPPKWMYSSDISVGEIVPTKHWKNSPKATFAPKFSKSFSKCFQKPHMKTILSREMVH